MSTVTSNKAIYNGKNSLVQMEEVAKPAVKNPNPIQKNGQCVAIIVESYKLKQKNSFYELNEMGKISLGQYIQRLYSAPYKDQFSKEYNPGLGTAFLYTQDTLLTAGHCAHENREICDLNSLRFIFDFKTLDGKIVTKFPKSNVYKPIRVAAAKFHDLPKWHPHYSNKGEDWAIFRLDRKVINRSPVTISNTKIKKYAGIYMIGHPVGLPMKFSGPANVQNNDQESFFKADIDSFGGNSGSPVFNNEHKVVGILVRGRKDFAYNYSYESVHMARVDNSDFEDIQRVSNLSKKLLNRGFISTLWDGISTFLPCLKNKKITTSNKFGIKEFYGDKIAKKIDYHSILNKIVDNLALSKLPLKSYLEAFEKEEKKLLNSSIAFSSELKQEYCVTSIAINCIKKEFEKLGILIKKTKENEQLKKMTINFLENQEKELEHILDIFKVQKKASLLSKFKENEQDIIELLAAYKIVKFDTDHKLINIDPIIQKALVHRYTLNKEKNAYQNLKMRSKSLKQKFERKIIKTAEKVPGGGYAIKIVPQKRNSFQENPGTNINLKKVFKPDTKDKLFYLVSPRKNVNNPVNNRSKSLYESKKDINSEKQVVIKRKETLKTIDEDKK